MNQASNTLYSSTGSASHSRLLGSKGTGSGAFGQSEGRGKRSSFVYLQADSISLERSRAVIDSVAAISLDLTGECEASFVSRTRRRAS